jgi:hypothetical protein
MMTTKTKSPLQGVEWPVEPFFVATMPLPPSVNASFDIRKMKTKQGEYAHALMATKALEDFTEEAYYKLRNVKRNDDTINAIKASKVKIPLAWHLDFYFNTLWKRDASGAIKAAEDAAFYEIGINDNRVVRFSGEKYVDRDNPRCEISIRVCTERIEG